MPRTWTPERNPTRYPGIVKLTRPGSSWTRYEVRVTSEVGGCQRAIRRTCQSLHAALKIRAELRGSLYEISGDPTLLALSRYLDAAIAQAADETAEKLADHVRPVVQALLHGTQIPERLPDVASAATLEDYCHRWIGYAAADPDISKTTLDNYSTDLEKHILPVLGETALSHLSARDVMAWTDAQRRRGAASGSIARRLRLLKRIFDRAVIDGEITSNPAAPIKSPAVSKNQYTEVEPGALTPSQIAALLEHTDLEWRLHLRVCFVTGLRSGEILATRYLDVDFETAVLRVHRNVKKGGTVGSTKTTAGTRLVPLDERTLQLLSERKSATGAADEALIWPGPGNKPWKSKPIGRPHRLAAWLKSAGITIKFTTHGTRRSYNNILVGVIDDPTQKGALRATVGHRNDRMTRHYSVKNLPMRANQQRLVADLIDRAIADRRGA